MGRINKIVFEHVLSIVVLEPCVRKRQSDDILLVQTAGGVQYSNTPASAPPDQDSGLGTLIAGGVILCLGMLFA
ncbi:hypothetical protein MSG28_004188, partial [Choristoneura fumiferana]